MNAAAAAARKRQKARAQDADGSNHEVRQPEVTARQRVREGIRRLILSGKMTPGSRLAQQHLAKQFGVAQSVVRESLLELQFSGLVEMVDNLGIFVGDLDTNTLLQAYEVREVLEGLAARNCCERASRVDLRELTEMAEEVYRLGEAGQNAERGVLDRRLHLRIIEISRNEVLSRLIEACHALSMTVQASRPHDVIRNEHLLIVKAIESNNCEEAERTARMHVAGARDAVRQQILAGSFTPKWVVD
jgi:DNA-binding GntR family transcriptional regulator